MSGLRCPSCGSLLKERKTVSLPTLIQRVRRELAKRGLVLKKTSDPLLFSIVDKTSGEKTREGVTLEEFARERLKVLAPSEVLIS